MYGPVEGSALRNSFSRTTVSSTRCAVDSRPSSDGLLCSVNLLQYAPSFSRDPAPLFGNVGGSYRHTALSVSLSTSPFMLANLKQNLAAAVSSTLPCTARLAVSDEVRKAM
eukprot:CAMPEP_0177632846 /NCGR_PEP_ID=MMETSP0447-20121125/2522_1 /TAXON_ID=0 /ORGANISM="Stygamoeba regulata, Strain BSH-02190019" /LENGTH=110 /DNA_ID=CAMNT_0019134467 /DNA_START=455 /DNA_END=787 /DNA_ORIENTATION=-